jgi:hypothetical protein
MLMLTALPLHSCVAHLTDAVRNFKDKAGNWNEK